MRLHFWQTKAHAELFSQSIPMKVMPLVFMSISLRSNSSCPQTGQIRGMSPTRYRVVGVTIDLAAALRPAPILPSVFFMGVSFSSRTSKSADDRRLGVIELAVEGLNGHSARRLVRLLHGLWSGFLQVRWDNNCIFIRGTIPLKLAEGISNEPLITL